MLNILNVTNGFIEKEKFANKVNKIIDTYKSLK